MKRKNLIIAMATALTLGVTSCDAMWGVDLDSGYPAYSYGYSLGGEWRPALPAAPLVSPVYWGNNIYPGPSLPPARPIQSNSPGGNVRPGQNQPSMPSGNVRPGMSGQSQQSVVPSHPINVTGGEPGIALPPAGTGYSVQGRH